MSDKNVVISKLVDEIIEDIEKEMPEKYEDTIARAKLTFRRGVSYVSEENYEKNYIKSWIRDWVKNDYKSLCVLMPEEKILSYEEAEIIQLLKVLFFLRKLTIYS